MKTKTPQKKKVTSKKVTKEQREIFKQCAETLEKHFPHVILAAIPDDAEKYPEFGAHIRGKCSSIIKMLSRITREVMEQTWVKNATEGLTEAQ